MIAEMRELSEKEPLYEKYIKELEDYLRANVDATALHNDNIAAAIKTRLAFKAKDMSMQYKIGMSEQDYYGLAEEAVNRYVHNQKVKSKDSKRGKARFAHIDV